MSITKQNHKPYKKYELKANRYHYYKGRHIIAFYDKDDEFLLYMFDNVKEILKFQNKEINKKNLIYINTVLYQTLKGQPTITRMLTGEPMRVHIIDILDE